MEDDDRADEIEDLSLEEYADRKKVQIANPKEQGGTQNMPTKRELEQEIAELEERNAELEDALAAISETLNSALPEDEEGDEEEADDE